MTDSVLEGNLSLNNARTTDFFSTTPFQRIAITKSISAFSCILALSLLFKLFHNVTAKISPQQRPIAATPAVHRVSSKTIEIVTEEVRRNSLWHGPGHQTQRLHLRNCLLSKQSSMFSFVSSTAC
jgi:hypothetical protein